MAKAKKNKKNPTAATIRARLYQVLDEHYEDIVEDLDEAVHDLKSREATDINNGGLDSQLDYLLEKGGPDWVEEYFEELFKDATEP